MCNKTQWKSESQCSSVWRNFQLVFPTTCCNHIFALLPSSLSSHWMIKNDLFEEKRLNVELNGKFTQTLRMCVFDDLPIWLVGILWVRKKRAKHSIKTIRVVKTQPIPIKKLRASLSYLLKVSSPIIVVFENA